MALHKTLPITELHRIQSLSYANQSAREGASGLTADDVGRVAIQTDDSSFYVLADHSPVTWVQITGSDLDDTDDLPEGSTNLYYTEARVSANSDVAANTAKVSADGSVTTHNDVTSAGSGQIITSAERSNIGLNTTHRGLTNNPHSTDVGNLGSGTLAELNAAITDATLDDSSDPRDPNAHTHTKSEVTDLFDEYGSDETSSTSTAAGFEQAYRFTTSSLTADTYEISWYCEAKNDTLNGITRVRVQLDDTTDLGFADIAITVNTTVDFPMAGSIQVALGAGTHTIDIDFYPFTGTTAEVRRKRVAVRRI